MIIKNNITETEFKEWLDSGTTEPLEYKKGYDTGIFIKINKNNDFLYLFKQHLYGETGLTRYTKFEYAGLYSLKQGLIYDSGWTLQELCPNLLGQGLEQMKGEVTQAVCEYVENKLGEDKSKLDLKELSQKDKEQLENNKKSFFKNKAAVFFLKGEGSQDIRYECQYSLDKWEDEVLLNYIKEPNKFVETQAEEYLQTRQDRILMQFESNACIRAELEEIEMQLDSPLYRQRDIIQTISKADAKTVLVTIEKEGKRFSFKYEASLLMQLTDYYASWRMARKERDEFEELFGCGADIHPEDIVDISYRGKSLYSAEPYNPEPKQEPLQSM